MWNEIVDLKPNIHNTGDVATGLRGQDVKYNCLKAIKSEDIIDMISAKVTPRKVGLVHPQRKQGSAMPEGVGRDYEYNDGYNVLQDVKCDVDIKQEIEIVEQDVETDAYDVKVDLQKYMPKNVKDEHKMNAKAPESIGKKQWFQCKFCAFLTNHKISLKKHFTVKHDEDAEWYQCEVCNYKTKDETHFKKHFEIQHTTMEKIYQCGVCEFTTTHKAYLERHLKFQHDEDAKWHQCEVCDYKSKRKDSLKRHFLAKHHKEDKRYQCAVCNYKVMDKYRLKMHFTTRHDQEAEWYHCEVCDYKTKSKYQLNHHFKSKHNQEAVCQ